MSSFQDLSVFRHNDPEAETQRSYAHSALNDKTERESMRVTPLVFYLRVIANENPLNLENTTSSVLSVLLLIYDKLVWNLEFMLTAV
jgi:hypothetical protein